MKKVLSLTLALSMLLCFVACGGDDKASKEPELPKNDPAVESFVDEHYDLLIGEFSSLGDVDLKVSGSGLVLTLADSDFDGATDDQRDTLQAMAETDIAASFESILGTLQKECPELTYITFTCNDSKGARVFSITVGNK